MPESILKKKPFSDNMDFTYTGDLNENCLPHGKGTQESLGWGKYVGTFESGQRHGRGVFTFPDGKNKYEGQFKYGKFSGNGKLSYGGRIYTSVFFNGSFGDGFIDVDIRHLHHGKQRGNFGVGWSAEGVSSIGIRHDVSIAECRLEIIYLEKLAKTLSEQGWVQYE